MKVPEQEWQRAVNALIARMQLDFLEVVYSGTTWEGFKVVIAPLDNGMIPREELLAKEIPFEFIAEVRKLFPASIPLFVRPLITDCEIQEGMEKCRFIGEMWGTQD